MTKNELYQLYYLNKEIERQRKKLEELESAVYKTTPHITGMPTGTSVVDKVGTYAAEIADLKTLISANIQRCWQERNRLERYIQKIEDSQLRQIFTLRYVDRLSWQRIAFEIGEYDESYPRRKHNQFLKLAENTEL